MRTKPSNPWGPPATGPWQAGPPCDPPALEQRFGGAAGAALGAGGAALPGGARGAPAGGGRGCPAGALRQGGTRLHNEPRACRGSPSSALPPPPPFIYFIYFYCIYLFVFAGIIKMRKSERCFWLLSTNLSVTQAETT